MAEQRERHPSIRFGLTDINARPPDEAELMRKKKGRENGETKKGVPIGTPYKKWAATYFSTNKCSIISEGGLNFSVRNGKR